MQIGFIGIGVMGRPMALNLLKAEHHVTIYARHPDKPEVQEVLNAGAHRRARDGPVDAGGHTSLDGTISASTASAPFGKAIRGLMSID